MSGVGPGPGPGVWQAPNMMAAAPTRQKKTLPAWVVVVGAVLVLAIVAVAVWVATRPDEKSRSDELVELCKDWKHPAIPDAPRYQRGKPGQVAAVVGSGDESASVFSLDAGPAPKGIDERIEEAGIVACVYRKYWLSNPPCDDPEGFVLRMVEIRTGALLKRDDYEEAVPCSSNGARGSRGTDSGEHRTLTIAYHDGG